MSTIEFRGTSEATPQLLATLFWNLDSTQMADFFESLERIAGVKLCEQMAYAVWEIQARADAGNPDAQNGFQTMLSHAQDYVRSCIEHRHWRAKYEIRQMVEAAKATHAN